MLPAPGTAPPSRKRKVVCSGCRLRKKRCDGLHPACTACRKWNERCDYTSSSTSRQQSNPQTEESYIQGEPHLPLGWDFPSGTFVSSLPDQGVAPPPLPLTTATYIPSNDASIAFAPYLDVPFHDFLSSTPITSGSDLTNAHGFSAEGLENLMPHADSTLPSHIAATPTNDSDNFPEQDRLVELAETFLDNFHVFLPFLHRASFLESIKSRELLIRAPTLVYAIIAIASKSHPDPTIQAKQDAWYCKAKSLYEETAHDPHHPLQIIQAAACIVFQALTVRDFSVVWLVMGKAWRQAVALGFHRLDGDRMKSPARAPEPNSGREKEEQRRTMWTLFILDRGMSYPIGLPHAIDDRQFMANLPLDDSIFQGTASVSVESATKKPFSRNFTKLVTSIRVDPDDPSPDLFRFIIVSYVLLGRIAEHMQAPYASTDPDEYLSEFQGLDSDLIRLRLSIPRSASFLPSATADSFRHVVWLNTVINICTMLLHGRSIPKQTHSTSKNQEPGSDNATDLSQNTRGSSEQTTHWSYALTAARSTVDIVKDASRVAMEILFNPHISVAFYLSGRIIAVEYLENKFANTSNPQRPVSQQQQEKYQSLRTDIDILLLLFDRLTEVFRGLGIKFKSCLLYYLDQDAETVQRVKAEGVKGLLGSCPEWSSRV